MNLNTTKYSIGNVVVGGNTLKNSPDNNEDTTHKVSQAGQGIDLNKSQSYWSMLII